MVAMPVMPSGMRARAHAVMRTCLQSNKKRKQGPSDNTNAAAAKRGFVAWDGGRHSHVRFVMAKENLDSHAALALLARFAHAPPGVFAVAGTKDKRGVTVQHVTAHKVC